MRELWRPKPGRFSSQELADALVEGGCAGPACSHDRANVLWKIERLVGGDPDAQFGMTGLAMFTEDEVLALMAVEAGFDPSPHIRHGDMPIDPVRVIAACQEVGQRLSWAASHGQRAVVATGHPAGLIQLATAVGDLLEEHGAKLLRPANGWEWRERGHHRRIRYLQGVAVLTDRGSTMHTHSAYPMELMLEDARPDLVFADHGLAGAAIEARIDTVSIADVNDPALVVAKHLGRTEAVIVMDDNVEPESYWPCFQAIASQFF
jgi:Phosphatase